MTATEGDQKAPLSIATTQRCRRADEKQENQQVYSVINLIHLFSWDLVFSILGRVIPKTLKMVLDIYLLNTQHYKVRIKGKVEQSKERSSTLPNNSV